MREKKINAEVRKASQKIHPRTLSELNQTVRCKDVLLKQSETLKHALLVTFELHLLVVLCTLQRETLHDVLNSKKLRTALQADFLFVVIFPTLDRHPVRWR